VILTIIHPYTPRGIEVGSFQGVDHRQLALVRVQGGLLGVTSEKGMLVLDREGSARPDSMNTFHFALNGVVTSHIYGYFDSHAYAFIAPLDAVAATNGPPSGLGGADTWFHADGSGRIRLPDATLIAPDDAILPETLSGVRVVLYPTGNSSLENFENRNRAVRAELNNRGFPVQTIGMHGWSEFGPTSGDEQKELSLALGARDALPANHTASPDGEISLLLSKLNELRKDQAMGVRLVTKDSGLELPIDDEIQSLLSSAEALTKSFDSSKAGLFYAKKLAALRQELGLPAVKAMTLNSRPNAAALISQIKQTLLASTDGAVELDEVVVSELPGADRQ
jgi:hypothetical protein